VPDVQEDGQILLSVAYDNTVAKPLQTITFGEGDNQVQIQQITIDGDGTVQQVALRPGQPMIISGFDRRQDELQNRRLSEGLPLLGGGLDRLSHVETSTLLIVTAQAEEGF
jgi:predicted DNA-binding antitoxin AbrB/MazE fold protein